MHAAKDTQDYKMVRRHEVASFVGCNSHAHVPAELVCHTDGKGPEQPYMFFSQLQYVQAGRHEIQYEMQYVQAVAI